MVQPKGALIERCKRLGLPKPRFHTQRTGPEHEPIFVSDVLVGGEVYGSGQGSNKRDAERRASEEALRRLEGARADTPNTAQAPQRGAAPSQTTSPEGDFEGPWPVFAEVLAASLAVANSRVDPARSGAEAVAEVQRLALTLYKNSLEDLGEIVEVDEDDEELGEYEDA